MRQAAGRLMYGKFMVSLMDLPIMSFEMVVHLAKQRFIEICHDLQPELPKV